MESSVRIIFLLVVMRLSATEEVKKYLRGSVGGNITLPDPVQDRGFLLNGTTNIALVINREPQIEERAYNNRLHWDRNTGLFTLTGLQRNDSGIYTIDSKKGNVFKTSYELTVYDSVSTPAVKKLTVSSEICFLLCSVDRETETLQWFKDEEILNQSSSARSLPLSVLDFRSSYRCVAANPAENKTHHVDVNTLCAGNNTNSSGDGHRKHSFLYAVLSILLALAVIIAACIFKQKYFTENKRTHGQEQGTSPAPEQVIFSGPMGPEVEYSDIHICDKGQGEDSPDSSTTPSHSRLTTVYDKLEVHRMITEPDNV